MSSPTATAEMRRAAAEPFRVLRANRALIRLVSAFSAVTVAEWGFVTAMAIHAYRLNGTVAVGLVGLRLFFAALGIFSRRNSSSDTPAACCSHQSRRRGPPSWA